MHFDIKIFGWRPFHRETVINDVVAADVFIERGVVHPAVALDLCAKQLDPEGVVYERYVHDALDVLPAVLIQCHTEVAAPLHGDIATDDVDQATSRVLAKERALWSTQNLYALDVKVLHQDAADGA